MAQYAFYKKEVPKYWTDPDTGLRTREWITSDFVSTDYELVMSGFALAEDVGWTIAETNGEEVTGLRVREGVRNTYYVWDAELTPTGFLGVEGLDWININAAY